MHNMSIYQIEVKGQMDENAFNAAGPLRIKIIRTEPEATSFIINTDQSGLIGLLRYLHQQGFILLSVNPSLNKENL